MDTITQRTDDRSPAPPEQAARSGRIASSRNRRALVEIAPGVHYLTVAIVNLYLVGDPAGDWILVDTGLPGTAPYTRAAIERRFGTVRRPLAVVLTHGHFDHAGSARELADDWDVPIHAHRLELPYLDGRSDYAPQDPTIGGAISQMSRAFPHSGIDLGERLRLLPADGALPGVEGWRWFHTPGHTHGLVSLFREEDGVLLAGDALTTLDMDSWSAHATERREMDRPPAPMTSDWEAARSSVRRLAGLRPTVVGAGHGIPLAGPRVADGLERLADRFPVPTHGRYVPEPALADESGLLRVPPPVPDPLPGRLAAGAAAVAAGYAVGRALRRR